MSTENQATVDTPCQAYLEMAASWPLLNDLRGGTKAMRAAAETWLPLEPAEEQSVYNSRLLRSVLYPAYDSAIKRCVSKPFSKPVTIKGKLPPPLDDIENNVDGTGRNLTQFAREVFDTATDKGLTHILPDYPSVSKELTREQEQNIGARPTLIHVPPENLIGWRTKRGANGQPVLTRIRIRETTKEPDGEYGEQDVTQIRVITESTWEIHRKNEDGDYVLAEYGDHTFGGVSLVTLYVGQRTGFMTAKPPLEGLADLNLSHWQSLSDQHNILHFVRLAILYASGFTKKEVETGFVLGPNKLIHSSNPDAKLEYVEHTGKGVDAGEKNLQSLEERMEVLGLQPMLRKTGNVKATAHAINESQNQSDIEAWIKGEENVLVAAYKAAAQWVNKDLPEDFEVNIFSDFTVGLHSSDDITRLRDMRRDGDLSHDTYVAEGKRRGLLSEGVDAEQERELIKQEGPKLGMIGLGD